MNRTWKGNVNFACAVVKPEGQLAGHHTPLWKAVRDEVRPQSLRSQPVRGEDLSLLRLAFAAEPLDESLRRMWRRRKAPLTN